MGLLSKAIANINESIRSLADSQNNLITIKTTNKDISGLVKLHNFLTYQKSNFGDFAQIIVLNQRVIQHHLVILHKL